MTFTLTFDLPLKKLTLAMTLETKEIGQKHARHLKKKENQFLYCLRSIATQKDHFVRRLSVPLSVCLSLCLSGSHILLIDTHSYVSQVNMHSSECFLNFFYIYCFNTVLSNKRVYTFSQSIRCICLSFVNFTFTSILV